MTNDKDRLSFIIGTAGHIDHGKTALVRRLTGMDTDRLSEEKRRGVSIDLGFAWMEVPVSGGSAARAAVVDVPGHERFVRNMLAGTTGVDLVLFTVAADDGVMPQTREHLDIVDLLGISTGVFVVTKPDLATAERVEEVKREVASLIEGTSLEGSPVVAASSATGDGVEEVRKLIIERLGHRAAEEGWFRLPVDRSFTVKGFGAVATGTVASGSVARGDDLVVFPTGARVKVRGVQCQYEEAGSAGAGQRTALNVTGASHRDIKRGFMLASPALAPLGETARRGRRLRVDCRVRHVAHPVGHDEGRAVRNHALLKLHHFTGETLARVVFSGRREVAPGESATGRLVLREPLLMMAGDRFILRDPSDNATIGGGVVSVTHLDRRLAPPVNAVEGYAGSGTPPGVIKGLLGASRAPGVGTDTAALMVNMEPGRLTAAAGEDPDLTLVGDCLVTTGRLAAIEEKVRAGLAAFHRAEPAEDGMEKERLRRAVMPGGGPDGLFDGVIVLMEKAGEVRTTGARVGLAVHRAGLSGKDAEIEGRIRDLFGGFPPAKPEKLGELGFSKGDVDRVLDHMVKTGGLVRVKEKTFMTGEKVGEAIRKLEEYLAGHDGIKAAEYRDVLGCGRKLAIELLEYFDRERVTLRRPDDSRILR